MFEINGILWTIEFASPMSDDLRRSDGSITVGVTDFTKKKIFLSRSLRGAFLRRVLAHELCHAFCFSHNIYMDIDEEEHLADWVSLYGAELVYLLDDLMETLLRKIS